MPHHEPTLDDIRRCLLPIARRVPSLRVINGQGFRADDYPELSFISMFSGIEAASVAFNPLGWKAVCFAEIEKFPAALLAHHYPDVPNVGDMTQHDWSQYRGKVDIVCGGPPCQAFSVAGLRESLNDPRGNLSLTYMKALHAISPRNAIVENVPGWLSTKDNAFGCFLAGLVRASDALPPPLGNRWPNAASVSSLSQILEMEPIPPRYFLSLTACAGILRRAEKRGKALPEQLHQALQQVAGVSSGPAILAGKTA